MDPLAHTLVGAAMAETGLKRTTALGTATLIIGANLPDIDAVATLAGQDTALLLRRGVTHGVIALVVLPWLLAGAMILVDRWLRRREGAARVDPHPGALPAQGQRKTARANFKALLGLSYLGVLSHPFLDWLNTYGVRVLSPFSDRWFYGDTLFIIDAWMWLLAGCAVVLAHSQVKSSKAGWIVIGALTSALVLFSGMVPLLGIVLWLAAIATIIYLRIRNGPRPDVSPLARGALGVLVLYIVAMFGGSRLAERQTRAWAEAKGWPVEQVMANPVPAHPFKRDMVVVLSDRYEFAMLSWFAPAEERLESTTPAMPRLVTWDPVVNAALESPRIRGFRNWMRFPSALVDSSDEGHRVRFYDVRYARLNRERAGIGYVEVEVDPQLRAR